MCLKSMKGESDVLVQRNVKRSLKYEGNGQRFLVEIWRKYRVEKEERRCARRGWDGGQDSDFAR